MHVKGVSTYQQAERLRSLPHLLRKWSNCSENGSSVSNGVRLPQFLRLSSRYHFRGNLQRVVVAICNGWSRIQLSLAFQLPFHAADAFTPQGKHFDP